MAQKTVKTRIQQKRELEVDWLKATSFVPLAGEIIVYEAEVDADGSHRELPSGRTTPYTYARFKIGDGIQNVNDLPFTLDNILADAKAYVDNAILNGAW